MVLNLTSTIGQRLLSNLNGNWQLANGIWLLNLRFKAELPVGLKK